MKSFRGYFGLCFDAFVTRVILLPIAFLLLPSRIALLFSVSPDILSTDILLSGFSIDYEIDYPKVFCDSGWRNGHSFVNPRVAIISDNYLVLNYQ